ncbi:MAG: hypothetical protein EBT62_09595, partial [Opitutaceae bacterium]|nr:hypothetical protein [Opitutaceae bacterium]
YADEGHWKEGTSLRRYTLRVDGFVSLHARQQPGELLTPQLIFTGHTLSLNFATTAAGSIRVELQDQAGQPLPGYSLAECDELFGDTLNRTVTWGNRSNVSALAGKSLRLRIILREADLYSLKFEPAS